MRKFTHLFLLCVAVSLILPSCVSKKKFDELSGEKEALDKMLTETKGKVTSLEGDVESLQNEKSSLESKNADLSNRISALESEQASLKAAVDEAKADLAEVSTKYDKVKQSVKTAFGPADASGLSVETRGDRLYVTMSEPILFRSGSTRLQRKFRDPLKSLADVLKSNPDLKIQAEGHTDDLKMKEGARFVDNWDLSTARAMSVVRYLIGQGVSETQLAAVGKGEFLPSTADKTSEARAQNRRVEIVVVPNVSGLFKANKEGV